MFEVHVSKHSLFSWRRHSQDHGGLSGVVCALFCGGGACVWCVVKLGTHTLSLSLSFALSLSFLFSFPFAFPFFFSLIFIVLSSCSSSFSLAPSLLSSLFCLLFLFLFSLLFSPPNTMERTVQPTRRPTSRQLNVIWRKASAQQSVLSLLLSPPSSLLPLPSSKNREGTFNYRNISGDEFIFYSFKYIPKNRRRWKSQSLQFYIYSKTKGL